MKFVQMIKSLLKVNYMIRMVLSPKVEPTKPVHSKRSTLSDRKRPPSDGQKHASHWPPVNLALCFLKSLWSCL